MERRRPSERFDFSLDSKQVALLVVLGLVILVLVFALGVIIGRGLQHPEMPAVAAQGEAVESETADPVTETTDLAVAAPETPAGANEAPVLKFYANGASQPVREMPMTRQSASKPARPAAVEESVPKAATKKPAPVVNETKSSSKAVFTIQVSAFQDKNQADQLVSRLKRKGYDAFITRAAIPGKGTWYRVRVGRYASRDEAQAVAATLKRKEGISTYVTLNQ